MSELKVRTRAVGARAVLKGKELPIVTSETGGEINIVTSVSQPGFNPLDLLYASLSACIALSARIAAGKLGVGDRLEAVRVHVTGKKADDEPSRVALFSIEIEIDGDLDAATRRLIVEKAEEICTVSNTLRGDAKFLTTLKD